MSDAVLVTGASGFIGREVVRLLSVRPGASCVAFSRRGIPEVAGVRSVRGDLLNLDDLDRAFEGVGQVIHLAAATGKASESEMDRVNVEGTGALIAACTQHGVDRFIHVSTIAVNYPDLSDYPYGRSKRAAEKLVISSTLAWTVVRPTIVLGPASPAMAPMRSLAAGPALMLPGGGSVEVQPIDVRDVAAALVALADTDNPHQSAATDSIIELGGPRRMRMRELLEAVRAAAGKGKGPAVPIPLSMLRGVARVATTLLGSRSPVTPGQLSAFRFDSVASPQRHAAIPDPVHRLAAMVGSS